MTLVEVITSHPRFDEIKTILSQCCANIGDTLLGSKEYREVNEALFLVHLTQDTHRAQLVATLKQALQDKLITSFRFGCDNFVKLMAPDILEQMHNFPLSFGDSWIPDAFDDQNVYVCTHKALLTAKQAAWLLLHEEVRWSYL